MEAVSSPMFAACKTPVLIQENMSLENDDRILLPNYNDYALGSNIKLTTHRHKVRTVDGVRGKHNLRTTA
ncbi:hypothetical protein Tco_1458857 [Tanacetum coccineum]